MQTLIEDRHKWEEEFMAERAAHERDAGKRIHDMQAQMEVLIKLISDSHKASGEHTSGETHAIDRAG